MIKRVTALVLTIIMAFGFVGCSKPEKTRYEAEFLELFDTLTKIVAYTDSKEEFTAYSQLIYDELKIRHELYDIYHDYPGINNIKTINDNAGKQPVKVDPRIIELLKYSQEWYAKTDGKMNIAFGAVLRIWHDYRIAGLDDPENAELPRMEDLKKASQHTDINKMIIDEKNSTVYLADPEMRLDVGAVAKGFATEKVSMIAYEKGFKSGIVSVGGNVRALGNKGDGTLWNLGIQNPDTESENKNLRIVYMEDMSLVSSGVYERFYVVNDKPYHHIIDPETLFPSDYFLAVTIATSDSGLADVLSTAIFNMPFEQGLAFINSHPDTEAMWVMKDGTVKYSDDFQKYLEKK